MIRRNRVMLVIVLLIATIFGMIGLAKIGSGSQGPLSAALEGIGTAVGSLEHTVRSRFRGSGRSEGLAWFASYRQDPAPFRNPNDILLGAYDSRLPGTLDGVVALEHTLGPTLPLIQIYAAWGDKETEQFPRRLTTAIWDLGSVPVVTWEPWLADFESARHPQLPLRDSRDQHGLVDVARGEYDFYIDTWAAEAARFAHPIMIRFAHEMNDPYRYPWGPQHNSKEEYIAAWRHVVERFRHAGARNVIWVWSPHVAYQYWDLYYPGDDYVDWVATGALNFGPIAQWSRWWSFAEIFGKEYPRLASFKKPVMVAEFGSLGVGGDRAGWYHAALDSLPEKYPSVRALLFFNAQNDQTVTYQNVDWTVTGDSAVVQAIREGIRRWAPPRAPAPKP